ncbi:ribosomal 40S subunit protein S10B [Starmerella bacillaris]|uniref:Ribosomal 40S subunit protein S10B n=1 Tax=Starmerella bacillaris TaxID=1247836 RepID=A0AAV5RM38_STABA|nr:ribosomal 40S subunit protein S10B [Starmerella bacillaris]
MLIPTDQRRKIHEYLFNEGVCVAKKDFECIHEDLQVKNLYVIKAMQSLNSKGFVKTQFVWQYYYYTLTDEGVEYLRDWLYLPSAVSPATHQQARPAAEGKTNKAVDAQAQLA